MFRCYRVEDSHSHTCCATRGENPFLCRCAVSAWIFVYVSVKSSLFVFSFLFSYHQYPNCHGYSFGKVADRDSLESSILEVIDWLALKWLLKSWIILVGISGLIDHSCLVLVCFYICLLFPLIMSIDAHVSDWVKVHQCCGLVGFWYLMQIVESFKFL